MERKREEEMGQREIGEGEGERERERIREGGSNFEESILCGEMEGSVS